MPGEENPYSKLDESKIRFIRDNPEWSLKQLAGLFGVNKSAIAKVRKRETWSHIP